MSPVIKFDVSDQDPDESTAAPEPPPPGLYKAKIIEATAGFKKGEDGKPDKKAPRIEVTYQVLETADKKNTEYKGGGRVWDYVTFYDTTKRRLDQFLQATGFATKTKRTGGIDPEKCVGKIVKLRVKGETSNTPDQDYRPKVAAVWKWDGASASDPEDDGLGEDTPAPAKVAGAKKAAKATKAVKKAAPKAKEEPDYIALGNSADEDGDDDAAAELTKLAEAAGEDPDAYPTWAELAAVLSGGGESAEEDVQEGPTLSELAESADGGDDEAGAKLTELAEANDIDPEQYPTWAEVATLLEEAGVDPNEVAEDPF